MYKQVLIVILFIACQIIGPSQQELYTAIADLEKLLHTEKNILSSLDTYLADEEKRLEEIRNIREKYARMHSIAIQDTQTYLANPVNAYLLVKRLSTDWKRGKYLNNMPVK